MLLTDLIQRSLERTPERTALIDVEEGIRYSYSKMFNEVNALAQGLQELGVDKQDRVAIGMKTSAQHVILNLAIQFIGAVAVPFNFRVATESLRYHIADAEPKIFAFDDALRDNVVENYSQLACDEFLVVGENLSFAHDFYDLLEHPAEKPEVHASPDDLSAILYTSGTTGRPKGVPIDQRSAAFRALDTAMAQGSYVSGDRTLSTMPLYHTIGLHSNCFSRLCFSGTFIPMPNFNAQEYLGLLDEERISVIFTAPTILNQLTNKPEVRKFAFDEMRVIGYGGEPISPHLVEKVRDAFGPEKLINIYGTTETYHPLALIHPAHSGRNGSFYRQRIVDSTKKDPDTTVSEGTEGELIISTASPIVFNGYWEKPEETREAIIDGWFFTGDTAQEYDGVIEISGRADDTIISGGENIHPREIEDEMISHPAIADIGVIGVPNDEWGEIVKAFVQLQESVEEEELDQWCQENPSLDSYKRPRAYEFVESIPRNPSGKVMRYKLRDR